ncbi:hypothetical protein CLOM_g15815 [Closterium sp. NIES-68]|nr:hypothetical protein CLOM_g15815 [Closterium sp. NIES-68]GJP60666.1 hypothetical protein CLOP_g17886 [Closterium sp. NIES-67]
MAGRSSGPAEKALAAAGRHVAGVGKHVEGACRAMWVEVSNHGQKREYQLVGGDGGGVIEGYIVPDTRSIPDRLIAAFKDKFFPMGYPDSVADGYMLFSQYRAVQHVAVAALNVLSTQSLLFAAGLRPTPVQATIVSWVVKDGMQHASKIAASRLGRSMDADPKRWRVAADVVCDVGAFLECLSPIMPHRFLLLAGLANAGKGLSLVIARATRLPLYDAFAREGNISDLYAKGEAISVLSSLGGLALGLKLASSVCQSAQAKLAAVPVLAAVHLWSVTEEMRAVPINTLNAQRTNVLINHFLSSGELLSPVDMRWKENIVKPDPPHILPAAHRLALQPAVQGVKSSSARSSSIAGATTTIATSSISSSSSRLCVGAPLSEALGSPSNLAKLKKLFSNEKFLLSCPERDTAGGVPKKMHLILHKTADGQDAIRGWLLASCISQAISRRTSVAGKSSSSGAGWGDWESCVREAYGEMEQLLPHMLGGLKEKGWHTHSFLQGSRARTAVW